MAITPMKVDIILNFIWLVGGMKEEEEKNVRLE